MSLLDSPISEGERLTETGALGLLIINYVFAISLATMQKVRLYLYVAEILAEPSVDVLVGNNSVGSFTIIYSYWFERLFIIRLQI